ncbi:MAG: aminoglycoside 6-adenylyltransferase [Candidatus Dormibacteria bacterium]
MDRERTLSEILDWASAGENIRAIVLSGSAGRTDGRADQFSDLDVELYAADPSPLLDDHSWYRRFGDVIAVEILTNPGWHPTRLVHMVDGKIDFMIADLASIPSVRDRPFTVLLDRDGLATAMKVEPPPAVPPPIAAYVECVNWFYAAALMEAKLVARGDTWHAKHREFEQMGQLLRMIEWDHKSRYGWDCDTWSLGKHFGEWADPNIAAAIPSCWAGYDGGELAAALTEAVGVFRSIAEGVGRSISAPDFDHDKAAAEIARILALRSSTVSPWLAISSSGQSATKPPPSLSITAVRCSVCCIVLSLSGRCALGSGDCSPRLPGPDARGPRCLGAANRSP